MRNLAGDKDADEIVLLELARCGVEAVTAPDLQGEVPAKHTGRLVVPPWSVSRGPLEFTFRRAWHYWVVDGFLPISVARKLYEHPVGRTDVRVAGHCGCPPPDEWAVHHATSGKKILRTEERVRCEDYIARETDSELMARVSRQILAEHEFADDPASAAFASGVDLYHIDSELGLYLFVRSAKGLDL